MDNKMWLHECSNPRNCFNYNCVLKASASKGRSKYYHNNHCQRDHAYFSVSKVELEKMVESLICILNYNKNNFDELKNALLCIFRKKQVEITNEPVLIEKNVLELKTNKKQAIFAKFACFLYVKC